MYQADDMTGGYTALSTKGVASLLSDTLWRALTFPITYLLVVVLVLSALAQIRYLNRALQHFDSTQVIPVQFVIFTISVIIGSAVLYRDFAAADADRFGKFFGGCALTFLGVYLITSGRSTGGNDHDIDDLEDGENAIGLVDEERYQDEVESDTAERTRRKSSHSVTFDDSKADRAATKYAKQPVDIDSPRTPPLLLSHTSTASSGSIAWTEGAESPLRDSMENFPGRPQARQSTISSPLLPSEAQRSAPNTPRRPSALSRRSMARLTPGPLMSPLSSSLSAVVADNLRRGIDSPNSRKRLSARGSRSHRATRTESAGDAVATRLPSSLEVSQLPEEAVDTGRPPTAGRSQSVSATLGDFFRLKRENSKGKSSDGGS